MSSLSIQLPRLSGLMSKSKLAHRLVSQSSDTDLADFKDLHSVLQTHGIDPKTVNTERDAISALLSVIHKLAAEKNADTTYQDEPDLDLDLVESERLSFRNYLKNASTMEVRSRYCDHSVWQSLTPEQRYAFGSELVDWSNRNELAPSKFWYAKGTL